MICTHTYYAVNSPPTLKCQKTRR